MRLAEARLAELTESLDHTRTRLEVAEQDKRAAEARLSEAERGAEAASEGAKAIWVLERLRAEREWADLVGPGVPLPAPWDGTISSLVTTELATIREVIGTPSEVVREESSGSGGPHVAPSAPLVGRVSVEMLRALARSGEEMQVRIGPNLLTVNQAVSPGEKPPDLSALAEVAKRGGFHLSVAVTDERVITALSWGDGR